MLLNEYVPTDLELIHDTTPVFKGDAQTDLVFQEAEADLPLPFPNIVGVTGCAHQAAAFYECDRTHVRIASPDGYRVHGGSVACHETGHAVGLVHGDDADPELDGATLDWAAW